jgi:hypothetical protein
MKTEITTAARRITKLHNDWIRSGFAGNGFLVCGRDGTGGAWYSDQSYPEIGDQNVKVVLRQGKISSSGAQEILDNNQ